MSPPDDRADVARIDVSLSGGGGYPVMVGVGSTDLIPELLAEWAPSYRYFLIADETVHALHGMPLMGRLRDAGLRVDALTFRAGEENKTRDEWARLTDGLLSLGAARDSCILALGGGVTGDLAGFVAATYMRGIPVVQIPTSLVAMVDASVGGKTGIDLPEGKNLVGAFHPPRFVVADPALALTLPQAERTQGMAEALKHGAIVDERYMTWIGAQAGPLLEGAEEPTRELVLRSVAIKASVVSEDEFESGRREILNFGHTVGHALEAATHFSIPHGDAVSIGMVIEARLGEALGVTEGGTSDRIAECLIGVGLPVALPEGVEAARIVELAGRDKKVREDGIRVVLLLRPGDVAGEGGWSRTVSSGLLEEALKGV